MPAFREHHNKSLISVADGKKVGEVKDVYLDKDLSKVTAVFLGKEGLINRKALVIGREQVQVFGIDVWLVSGSDVVTNPENLLGADSFVLMGDLRGREVQTGGGTKVGTIGDVVIDAQGFVKGFVFDKVLVQGPLAEAKMIARAAISILGSKTTPMITELEQAEKLKVGEG
jgi:sporulation protein YlmC with PRC-barrel domain